MISYANMTKSAGLADSTMPEIPTDYLICGGCQRNFPLMNIVNFMQHKRFDCDDQNTMQGKRSKILLCKSCPQKFGTPWSLLQHAQNVHALQIYLEQGDFSNVTPTLHFIGENQPPKNDPSKPQNVVLVRHNIAAKENSSAPQNQVRFQLAKQSMPITRSVLEASKPPSSLTSTMTPKSNLVAKVTHTTTDTTQQLKSANPLCEASSQALKSPSKQQTAQQISRIVCLPSEAITHPRLSVLSSSAGIVSPTSRTSVSQPATRSHAVASTQIAHPMSTSTKVDIGASKESTKVLPGDGQGDGKGDSKFGSSVAAEGPLEEDLEGQLCCDNQDCGVTLMPGTHEELKKCCSAVVPKKRKRHMAVNHMPTTLKAQKRGDGEKYSVKVPSGKNAVVIDIEHQDDDDENARMSSQKQDGQKPKPSQASEKSSPQQKCVIIQPGSSISIPIPWQSLRHHTSLGTVDPIPIHFPSNSSARLPVSISVTPSVGSGQLIKAEVDDGDKDGYSSDGKKKTKRRYPTSKPFKCDKCDNAFNQRVHLKKHQSKHTGIKPFQCKQCDYSTVEKSHLKVHVRVHTGEKPFKCTYCEYATAQNSTLKIHLKRHHGNDYAESDVSSSGFEGEISSGPNVPASAPHIPSASLAAVPASTVTSFSRVSTDNGGSTALVSVLTDAAMMSAMEVNVETKADDEHE